MIWRIGDGRPVRIWRDKWLPRGEELKVIGDKGRSRLIRVSSLIDIHGNWDEALVRKTFPPIDIEVMLNIKLSQRRPADFLAWQLETNGIFFCEGCLRIRA
jgi:hypothetical protein